MRAKPLNDPIGHGRGITLAHVDLGDGVGNVREGEDRTQIGDGAPELPGGAEVVGGRVLDIAITAGRGNKEEGTQQNFHADSGSLGPWKEEKQ
jgi:hypothetical protein